MSYILDALQRAEAERERGRVPGLKSQLLPPPGRDRAKPSALRSWHVLLGMTVLLVALGVWWWAGGTDAPAAPSSAPVVAPQPDAINTAPQIVPTQPPVQANNPQRIATPPEPVQSILAPPHPAPVATKPTQAATAPDATTSAASPAAAPPPANAPPANRAAVPMFSELTADARALLPVVNVSGSTYSQNPALRMLIANGKVVQEGQDIAPDLRLETIGSRSAVLNHQGFRYSIGY